LGFERYKYVIQLFLYKIIAMVKKIFFLFFTFLFCFACDDGDIIVTTFDFDNETNLQFCDGALDDESTEDEILIFNINNDTQETIAFAFDRGGFRGTFQRIMDESGGIVQDSIISINLSSTNQIIYRTYIGEVPNTYFCQNVPPSSPQVAQEFVSANGGSVNLNITIISQSDNDGIFTEAAAPDNYNGPFESILQDSDNDGIPDSLDTDDDNDNVSTLTETSDNIEGFLDPATGLPDTDQDGILNYLDNDDDADGTLSRNEDLNALENNNNPILNPNDDDADNDGVPNYLDADNSESLEVNFYKTNTISRTFRTIVVAKNITLNSTKSDEQIVLETLELGRFQVTINQDLIPVIE